MKKLYLLIVLASLTGHLLAQVSVIFAEDFENGVFASNIVPRVNLSGMDGIVEIVDGDGLNNSKGLKIGKLSDNSGFTTNALDIQLDLSNRSDVEMTFWIADDGDETNSEDGIFFSDNSGSSFTKVLSLYPDQWCDNRFGQHPVIDVDELAAIHGLSLSRNFVIRFQQYGDKDFRGSSTSADGLYMDDIQIYDPNLTYASLPFSDGFENGFLENHWSWNSAENTAVEPSAFAKTSPMSLVEVIDDEGVDNSYGLVMGRRCDGAFSVNAIDLHLNLQNQSDVEFSFWISDEGDQTDRDDGIYFSDDGGVNFVKALDFYPEEWCDNRFGQHPPLDIDRISSALGLDLTSNFIIRFQQRGDNDFSGTSTSSDGFYLDNVEVYNPNTVYATLPYKEDFETGFFENEWLWRHAENSSSVPSNFAITSPMNVIEVRDDTGRDRSFGAVMGRRCDGAFTVNALDLHLNLLNEEDISMNFWMADNGDETDEDDGIYFSDNAGMTFTKVSDFNFESAPDNRFQEYSVNVSELLLINDLEASDQFVIRFQQRGEDDFSGTATSSDGIYLDDINIASMTSTTNDLMRNEGISIFPNPCQDKVQISIDHNNFKKFMLMDISGKVLERQSIFNGEKLIQLNMSTIPSGLYVIMLVQENGQSIVKRFIKN